MSIYKNYYYWPVTMRSVTHYGWGGIPDAISESVVNSRYRYHSKGDNTNNPPEPDGWRKPASWIMSWKDGHRTIVDTYLDEFRKDIGARVTWSGGGHVDLPFGPNTPDYEFGARVEMETLNALRDAKVDLGVSFGERKEVARMMVSNFGKIKKSFTNFRRGNFRGAAQALGLGWKDAPNRWLEYQYGWKPLINDVYVAARSIAEKDERAPGRLGYFVRRRRSYTRKERSVRGTSFNGAYLDILDRTKYDCAVRFDFFPGSDLLKAADEWGLLNPLELAWELIPFSFIVDWALPVGDFLAASTNAAPYTFRGGSITHFVTNSRQAFLRSNRSALTASGHGENECKYMQRNKYYNFPRPDPRAFMAASSGRNTESRTIATRVANAMSILSSMFR